MVFTGCFQQSTAWLLGSAVGSLVTICCLNLLGFSVQGSAPACRGSEAGRARRLRGPGLRRSHLAPPVEGRAEAAGVRFALLRAGGGGAAARGSTSRRRVGGGQAAASGAASAAQKAFHDATPARARMVAAGAGRCWAGWGGAELAEQSHGKVAAGPSWCYLPSSCLFFLSLQSLSVSALSVS